MSVHFMNLLDDLRRRSLRMASQVEDMVHEACDTVFDPNDQLAMRIIERDEEVDSEEVAVEAEVIRLLALHQPVGVDLRMLCTILKVNNDLERVADCAVNVAERARFGEMQPLARMIGELKQLCPVVRKVLRASIQAYSTNDANAARMVREQEQAADALYGQIVRAVVASADHTPEKIPAYLDVLSVAKNLERIGDHATNIAEDVIFLSTGKIVRHGAQE